MYVYSLAPIDHWGGWMTPEQAVVEGNQWSTISSEDFQSFWSRAQSLAKSVGWEGDTRQGPFIAALPSAAVADNHFMIGWKQDNNGSTFVASPFRLDYLEREGWSFVCE